MSLTISVSEIVTTSRSPLLSIAPSWERVRLGDIALVLNGFAFPSVNFTPTDGMPLIRIRDILTSETESCYDGAYDATYLVHPHDLLIGMDGDFNSALWTGPVGLLNQRVCKVTANQHFYDSTFLSFALPGYLKAINDVTSSVTVKHLSSKSVEDIPLPLPPLAEQRRIVEAIEQQFTRLDAGVVALNRARAVLKRYRAAVLKAAVEGRLTAAWRAEHPNVEPASDLLQRILTERRAKWEADMWAKGKDPANIRYVAPEAPDTANLLELPEGWCWATVDQLLAEPLSNGISVKGSDEPPGIPSLKLSAMSDSGFDYSDRRYIPISGDVATSLAIQEGDFFVARGNGSLHLVGRGTLAQCPPDTVVFPDIMIRLRFLPIEHLTRYVSRIWSSRLMRMQIEGIARTTAGIYKISQRDIRRFALPLPSLAEQERIVAEAEERLSIVSELEATIEVNLNRADRLRQSILERAFAGKLVPQYPDDEPATVLLERIRDQRASEADGNGHLSKGTSASTDTLESVSGHLSTETEPQLDAAAPTITVGGAVTGRQLGLWEAVQPPDKPDESK